MSKKRFSWKTEKLQYLDDEVIMVVDNENKDWKGHILNVVDLLNNLTEENEQLKQKIQRWKTLYEIKDKEVTARVKRLNEICNQYKYAITFDKDIDPNDAVNILCDRILQTEVE